MSGSDHAINDDAGRKTFMGHLLELRMRIFVCIFFVLAATIASWVFWKQLATVIKMPVDLHNLTVPDPEKIELIITAPMEAFTAVLSLGLWAGLVLASPILLWEMWRFVAPGLYRREKFALVPILMLGPFLFAGGTYFCYRFVFPVGMKYLLSFAPMIEVAVRITLSKYMKFFLMMHVAFGFAFETPLLILALARLGLVTPRGLLRNSRFVIVGAFVAAAVLTPPDVLTQSMLAGVLIVLYFGSIILAWIFGKRRPLGIDEDEEAKEKKRHRRKRVASSVPTEDYDYSDDYEGDDDYSYSGEYDYDGDYDESGTLRRKIVIDHDDEGDELDEEADRQGVRYEDLDDDEYEEYVDGLADDDDDDDD